MAYSVRPHQELRPQQRQLIEISANGTGISLEEDWNERWCTLSSDFCLLYDKIYNFEVYEDDVYVVTFPSSGSTWMQEAVWLLLNNLDFEMAKRVNLDRRRSLFLDFYGIYSDLSIDTVEHAAQSKRPRLIMSHLPAHLLPYKIWEKKAKIIYCARNPKDVIVSYYPFHTVIDEWEGTIDDFTDDMINQDIMYTPYWPHVLDFWKMRYEPEIFFTTFEHMKRDLGEVLIKLNKFLGNPILETTKLNELIEHLSFQRMKDNEHTNPTKIIANVLNKNIENFDFMRRGIVGAYRDELPKELRNKMDEWTRKCLQGQNVTEEDIFETNLL